MSLWIGDKEIGLAPGQTEGDVGGTYVVRDPSSDISKPYIEATDIQTVTVPTGGYKVTAGGKTYYTNVVPDIGYYRPETGYTSVRRTGMLEPEQLEEQYRQQVASGQVIPNLVTQRKEMMKLEAARKSLIEQGYKPYVTIEGTTLYTKGTQEKEITVPKYGKFVQRGERTEPFLGVFTPDAFIDQVDDTQRKISLQVERLDREISEKYGLTEIVEPAVKTFRHAQFLAEREEKYKKYGGGQSELGKAGSEFAIGFTEELAQKPVTAAGNALFALLVTKGIGGLAAKAPILTKGIGTGKVASKINAVNILGTSLAGMYGISVAERFIEAPGKARFAGQITATELLPFAVGGYLGTKKIPSSVNEYLLGKPISEFTPTQQKAIYNSMRSFDIKKKKQIQKLEQILKPEVTKKAEEVEVIRADIALEKQLKAKSQSAIEEMKEKYRYTGETIFDVAQSKEPIKLMSQKERDIIIAKIKQSGGLYQKQIQKEIPIAIQSNIQKATTILKSAAITKAIQNQIMIQKAEAILKPESMAVSIQKSISIQEQKPLLRYKTIQEERAIQITKNIQIAETILKSKDIVSKSRYETVKKIRETFKTKTEVEIPIKKIPVKTAKKFIETVDDRYKRSKKGKWIWDVNNPVPTLEEVIS